MSSQPDIQAPSDPGRLPMTLPLMPVLSNRIAIHYVVESGAAPPSTATPSPKPSVKPSP